MRRSDLLEILRIEIASKLDVNALVYKSNKRVISAEKINTHNNLVNIFITRQRRVSYDVSPKTSKVTMDFALELIVGGTEDDISELDNLIEKVKNATISNYKILDNFQDPEISDIAYVIEDDNQDNVEKAILTGMLSLIEPDGFDSTGLTDFSGNNNNWDLN